VLAVLLETLKILHEHFLKMAHGAIDAGRWPRVLDLLWDRTSIVVKVCEYYPRSGVPTFQ
jgi:hypothetical protein